MFAPPAARRQASASFGRVVDAPPHSSLFSNATDYASPVPLGCPSCIEPTSFRFRAAFVLLCHVMRSVQATIGPSLGAIASAGSPQGDVARHGHRQAVR